MGEKKKKSSLRKTAGSRKLWGFHPAGFDSTVTPYHEKAKRPTSAVPPFNRRRKGFVDCVQPDPEDLRPDQTNTNNGVEKENQP